MNVGIGEGKTREDHRAVANQLYAALRAGSRPAQARRDRRRGGALGDRPCLPAIRRRVRGADRRSGATRAVPSRRHSASAGSSWLRTSDERAQARAGLRRDVPPEYRRRSSRRSRPRRSRRGRGRRGRRRDGRAWKRYARHEQSCSSGSRRSRLPSRAWTCSSRSATRCSSSSCRSWTRRCGSRTRCRRTCPRRSTRSPSPRPSTAPSRCVAPALATKGEITVDMTGTKIMGVSVPVVTKGESPAADVVHARVRDHGRLIARRRDGREVRADPRRHHRVRRHRDAPQATRRGDQEDEPARQRARAGHRPRPARAGRLHPQTLDERAREDLFRLKKVKKKIERRSVRPAPG